MDRVTFSSNKTHEQNVFFQQDSFGYPNSKFQHFGQIMQFLFRPHVNDFSGILFAKPISKPEIILDVFVSIFEFVQRGFEHFNGHFFWNVERILQFDGKKYIFF